MKKNNKVYLNFFKDKHGKWAIAQFPNFILLAWIVLTIILMFIGKGSLKDSIEQFSKAILFAWAYLELIKGDSSFRRLLGGVVLLSIIYSYFA